MSDGSDLYWGADPNLDHAVAAVDERVVDYYRFVESSGLLPLWRASNRACFSGFYTGGELGRVGKQGELRTIEVNDFGNLHQHLFNMLTTQAPTFEARTETADAKSQEQAPLGVAIADTAYREKGLKPVALSVADIMLRAGEAWGLKRWDPTKGEVYSTEPVTGKDGKPALGANGQPQERPVKAGDEEYQAYHPLDVARDPTRPADLQRWHVPRRRANRWDLVAQYPELAEKLKRAPNIYEDQQKFPLIVQTEQWSVKRDLCDDVWVWDAYFDDCPAVPGGRLISYVTPGCVLFDGPMPYRTRPLYRAAAKEMEGTPFGYSLLWDLLAPQIAQNNVLSQITTLASKLTAVVWQPDGLSTSPLRWQNVLTILQGGTVPPQVLDLLKIPAELFKLVDFYVASMERLSGVNSVARGQTAEGTKGLSGAAYAFFGARAIEFSSRFQGAYNGFLEDITTGTIHDYQDMGNGDYLITMAGEGNSYRAQSFMAGKPETNELGEPIPDAPDAPPRVHKIAKISVRLTNPLQSTTAGKMAMFDAVKDIPGAIRTPEQAIEVLTTGKVEPATQATQRELENIQKENERMSKGEPVMALITDRHWMHMPEHASVGSTPEFRDDPNSPQAQALTLHQEQHAQLFSQMSPVIAAVMGCPPQLIQMLAMSQQPPPMPGGPGAPGAPPGEEQAALGPPNGGEMPNQPQMPTDPMTGQ